MFYRRMHLKFEERKKEIKIFSTFAILIYLGQGLFNLKLPTKNILKVTFKSFSTINFMTNEIKPKVLNRCFKLIYKQTKIFCLVTYKK